MKKLAILVVVALAAGACVTFSPNYRLGSDAELNKQFDQAITYYEKAAMENPREPVYRLALDRAKISASYFHLQEARKLLAQGKREEAKGEYAKALALNPRDTQIALEARQAASEAKPEVESKPTKLEFPIKLKAKDEALQLRFRTESSVRAIFQALGKAAGVTVIFDENFRDVPFATELGSQTFEGALKVLCQATKNFYRIIDERTVIIIPDQPLKRAQYEVNAIRTFYLSNIAAQDVFGSLSQMLRTQYAAPNIIFDKNLNTVTVRGTPGVIEQADKLLRMWDKPKGEVVIDVEIMEVSRLKLRQLGLDFDNNVVSLRYGQAPATTTDTTATTSNWFNLKGIDLGQSGNYSLSLPVAFVQFLESDTDTKIIAQPRLRGVSDEKITDKVGQKVPIPQTQFSPIAAGGFASQPLTSYTYQDVGIDLAFTPRVHREKDVTLEVEIKVSSLGGTGYADIPILNNREIKSVVRLRDGETQLIAGLLRDEERKTLKGIPGLKSIPGIGRLFSNENTTIEQTDVIMTITPYIIRTIPMSADDGKAVWVDIDTSAPPTGGVLAEEEALDRDLQAAEAQRNPNRPADASQNLIALSPANFEIPNGREFSVAVNFRTGLEVGNMSLTVNFNPQLVQLKDVVEGGLAQPMEGKPAFFKNIDNGGGSCALGFSSLVSGKGVAGGGTLATLRFEAKYAGEAVISISGASALTPAGAPIPFQTTDARVAIK